MINEQLIKIAVVLGAYVMINMVINIALITELQKTKKYRNFIVANNMADQFYEFTAKSEAQSKYLKSKGKVI